jgi:hypothetical protein
MKARTLDRANVIKYVRPCGLAVLTKGTAFAAFIYTVFSAFAASLRSIRTAPQRWSRLANSFHSAANLVKYPTV